MTIALPAAPSPNVPPRRALGRKLALALIGLVSFELIVEGVVSSWLNYREARATAVRLQREKAQSAAERINFFVSEIENQIGWTTRPDWGSVGLDQRRYDFIRLLRQAPAITELTQVDAAGKEQLRLSRLEPDIIDGGKDLSADPRFSEAAANKIWFSPVTFRHGSEPYMTIATAQAAKKPGVVIADVNLKLIWDAVSAIRVGESGNAYVVDARGKLIAHPDISLVLRETDLSALPQVAAALANPNPEARDIHNIVGDAPEGGRVLTAHAAIPRLGWTVFVQQPLREALAPLYASLIETAALLGLGLLLASLLGLYLARRIVAPIALLQAGAQRLGAGDLSQRLSVRTGDEIEALADQFNLMAGQVRESHENLEGKVEARTQELGEALERQTATSEILRVISQSPTDVQPVFNAIVLTALRLFRCDMTAVMLCERDTFTAVALARPEGLRAGLSGKRLPIDPGNSLAARAIISKRMLYVPDWSQTDLPEMERHIHEVDGVNAALFLPLLRGDECIGLLALTTMRPNAFSASDIALAESFRDQALIAIENTRLFRETQEALQQQTATADVLKVISRSAFDLDSVLTTLIKSATTLSGTEEGVIYLRDGDVFKARAEYNCPPAFLEHLKTFEACATDTYFPGPVIRTGEVVQIADTRATEIPLGKAPEIGDFRALLGVPMLRKGRVEGVFTLANRTPGAFSQRQTGLVETFADQAVIAIENVRLFEDVQARTKELTESLEYQTATSDVLEVISRSPNELQPVLDSVVALAAQLCSAPLVAIHLTRGSGFPGAARFGFSPEMTAFLENAGHAPGRGTLGGRTMIAGVAVHIPDVAADADYTFHEFTRRTGARSMLGVPLLREGKSIGVILLYRTALSPFAPRQIELMETFADQAVIAINNVRLFDEVQARTRELSRSVAELKALGEVGAAVTATLDLQKVQATIVTRAVELAGADAGAIFRYRKSDRSFRLTEAAGLDADHETALRSLDVFALESAMGEAIQSMQVAQIADIAARPGYPLRNASLAAGFQAALILPLAAPGRILGALVLQKRATGEFPDNVVNLMQTFASQSVLAIQNARLFEEIAEKSHQLELASQHKSQFLANMSHELRTPLNAILGYAELLVDGIYGALADKPRGILERVQQNGRHLLGLINDVLDLSKIEAGQLTLTLEDYTLPALVDAAVSATASLAQTKGLKLLTSVAPNLPHGHGDARRLTQVLLNLVGNALKFTDKGEVRIEASSAGGRFRIAVSDTGPGIAEADQKRIFEEFRQVDNTSTRNKGGSGLGLAISTRIVEMHGGAISVTSAPGAGSTFTIDLPVQAQKQAAAA